MADEVDDVLNSLVASVGTPAAARQKAATTPIQTVPDRQQTMLNVFQQAFPDQEFVAGNEGGRLTITGRKKTTALVKPAVPEGYAPARADTGIRELQTALTNATDDEEKHDIAIRLGQLVTTQKMYKFEHYRKQAEAQFRVPDLEAAIDAIHKLELASPDNPGGGAPSQQRYELMIQLGQTRNAASNRIKELMATDHTYIDAENLAAGTLASLEGKMKFEGRRERLDAFSEARERKSAEAAARKQAISVMDPTFLNRISMMERGRPATPEEATFIATQLHDGKKKLDKFQTFLASTDHAGLQNAYMTVKDLKEKLQITQVLKAEELMINGGDKKAAEQSFRLFERTMATNLADVNDPTIPPDIRLAWKTLQSEANAQQVLTGKGKEEYINERKPALMRRLLEAKTKDATYADVRAWKGAIASDITAQAVFRAETVSSGATASGKIGDVAAENKKLAINVNAFIDKYLRHEDGKPLADKSRALENIIVSAIQAAPRSALLPPPSAESALTEAKRIVAIHQLRMNSGFFSRWGKAGVGGMGLDLDSPNL